MSLCVYPLYPSIFQFVHRDSPSCWAMFKWDMSQLLQQALQTQRSRLGHKHVDLT